MSVGLDFETFSSVNLPEKGLDNYVKSDDFRVLLASYSSSDGEATFDFVNDSLAKTKFLWWLGHQESIIIAHNAPFERAVLNWLDPDFDYSRVEDSAVDARMLGAGEKLIVASRQLTDDHKLEEGKDLVMLFCVPNELYPEGATATMIKKHGHEDKWKRFIEYCEMDAKGCRAIRRVAETITARVDPTIIVREAEFENVTFEMNQAGWHVDLPLVQKMKQRAWANNIIAKRAFLDDTGQVINFNSSQQLKKFCEDRGVKVESLDKYRLPVVLATVKKRIAKLADRENTPEIAKAVGRLEEVEALLETKLEIGGSALTKLPKILDLMHEDGQLRDQYVHLGAPQTFRTNGRGVQMLNLKKLGGEIRDMDTVYDLQVHWSNGDMADQLRQVFTSRHPDGKIIVGDFSAVESRGLAYQAGEEWKLDAYRQGLDVYKVLVTKYMGIEYDEVTAEQRPRGKYSELSCGYQASGNAVQDFMFRLGFSVSIEDATQNVVDWRNANPAIIQYWQTLDEMIRACVENSAVTQATIGYGMQVRMTPFQLQSMADQHPGSVSVCIQIIADGAPFVTRFVHGCYVREKSLCYYKPADDLRGELWKATYVHPKTKKDTYYSIYGGKIAGILTQSLCREQFFYSAKSLSAALKNVPNAVMVGQFHDEIAVDWWPGEYSEEDVKLMMQQAMSTTALKGFPLAVEIKSAYRYIK